MLWGLSSTSSIQLFHFFRPCQLCYLQRWSWRIWSYFELMCWLGCGCLMMICWFRLWRERLNLGENLEILTLMRLKVVKQRVKYFRILLSSNFLVWVMLNSCYFLGFMDKMNHFGNNYRANWNLEAQCPRTFTSWMQFYGADTRNWFFWKTSLVCDMTFGNLLGTDALPICLMPILNICSVWGWNCTTKQLLRTWGALWMLFYDNFWIFLEHVSYIPRSCSTLYYRMLAVNREQGCLLWTAQAEMLARCLIAWHLLITGLSCSLHW